MKKEEYFDGSNLSLKRKENNEVLEISSTGYGLESVPKELEEDELIRKER